MVLPLARVMVLSPMCAVFSTRELFREHSLACFVSDPTALKVRHDIGMDMIAWECDYPHSDYIWPDAPETIHGEMVAAGCTDKEMDQITWANATRFLDLDVFATIPREQATVGALRAGRDRRRHHGTL